MLDKEDLWSQCVIAYGFRKKLGISVIKIAKSIKYGIFKTSSMTSIQRFPIKHVFNILLDFIEFLKYSGERKTEAAPLRRL